MKVVSAREEVACFENIKWYLKSKWAYNKPLQDIYDDCFANCKKAATPLPQWYALMEDERIIGCAGLITNDFISRMDLYPWICSLYIEEDKRGNGLGEMLIDKAKTDARKAGFRNVYLCTDHVGYYEHYGLHRYGLPSVGRKLKNLWL
jgi:N-acetylglutamate synthase-like GNAT family acetyltransferase